MRSDVNFRSDVAHTSTFEGSFVAKRHPRLSFHFQRLEETRINVGTRRGESSEEPRGPEQDLMIGDSFLVTRVCVCV